VQFLRQVTLNKPTPIIAIALLAILSVNAALIFTGVWLATRTISSPIISGSPALPEIEDISVPQIGSLDLPTTDVTSRPLFWSSRRPFEPIAEPVAPEIAPSPTPEVPDQILQGILITGDYRRALFRRPNETEGVWLNEGDSIDGWKISNVFSDHTTLESNDEIVKLELYPDGKLP